MLKAERSGTSLLLNDWYHRLSDEIYDEYFKTGAFPQCVDSLLANGNGRVQCLPESILQAGPRLGLQSTVANDPHDPETVPVEMEATSMPPMGTNTMSMSVRKRSDHTADPSAGATMSDISAMSSAMTSMMTGASPSTLSVVTGSSTATAMSGMPQMAFGPRGCSPPMMFKPGFDANSIPPETCTNTSSALFTFTADASLGWTALHLVNSGAVTRLTVSLDGHSMFVYAADGLYVTIQKVHVSER